jgi:hypothetical protein
MNFIRPALTRHFFRHYVEMVIAMYAGMLVLGFPIDESLGAAGVDTRTLRASVPALLLLEMAFVMTVPMVAWMRWHGHGWRPCGEMAASMVIPTLLAITLLAGGIVASFGTLMASEHIAMFPAMLIAMLVRPEEYNST